MVAAGHPVTQPSRGTLGRRETACAGSGSVIALSGLSPCPTCLAAQSRSSSPTSKARPDWSSNSVIGTTRCSSAPAALAGGIRAPRRARGRHAGRCLLRRLRECARRSPGRRRRAARARGPPVARRCRSQGANGCSHRPGFAGGRPVHRGRRPPRRAHKCRGHGGQVLVSQATQTLLEDEEEDLGIEFRDLGSQPLKGLDRPVHLYQVAAPGLPTEFPPLQGEEDAQPRRCPGRGTACDAPGSCLPPVRCS